MEWFSISIGMQSMRMERRGSLPEAARVVFARGDDLRAVVVEGAREDLVRVAFEHLRALAIRRAPQPRSLVSARRQHQRALRTERHLRVISKLVACVIWFETLADVKHSQMYSIQNRDVVFKILPV